MATKLKAFTETSGKFILNKTLIKERLCDRDYESFMGFIDKLKNGDRVAMEVLYVRERKKSDDP